MQQVYFMGGDTYVQSQPSSTWLEEQAARWPWKAHLLMNAPRAEAHAVLSQAGMLVVFCSLVENLPYVVAEARPTPIIHPICYISAPCLWGRAMLLPVEKRSCPRSWLTARPTPAILPTA